MKTKYPALLLGLIAITLCQDVRSQDDSTAQQLLQRIHMASHDTSRIRAYFDYALFLENIHLDSAAHYYRLGGDLSKKIGFYDGLAHYSKNYSVVLNMQGKFAESMEVNRMLQNMAKAKGHQQDLAKSLNNIASVFNHTGQFDSAYHYYLQSARLFEQLNEPRYLHIIYQNIAIILDNLKQYDKALGYHRSAIEKSYEQKDTAGVAAAMINAAGTLNSLQRYDSSLKLTKQALELARKVDNLYYQHVALLTMGNIYAQQKNFMPAVDHFNQCLEIARRMNYLGGQSIGLNGLAMTYMKMGRYREADRYSRQGMAISDEAITFEELVQRVKLAAEIKSNLGQFDSAYHYLVKYTTMQDSLAGITTQKHVAGLEMKYQTALKDKSIAEQQLEIRENEDRIRKRNTWLLVAAGAILLVSAIFLFSFQSYRSKKKLLNQTILTLQKEKELESMKAAIEAKEQERQRIGQEMHDDLGAGLTTILYQVNALKSPGAGDINPVQLDKINETATGLISQMRDIVWAMNNEYDTIDDLVAYLRQQAGTLLSQAGIAYEFHAPEEIPPVVVSGEQRRNVYLAAKEALHNIIRHSGASQVMLDIEVTDALSITITDNGKGLDEQRGKWGNGLKNMEGRMRQAGGSFSISPARPGVKITLRLQCT